MRKLLTRILIYIIAQIIIHNKHKQRRNRRWCAAYSWSLFTGCVSREISSQPRHNDMIMYHDTVAVVPPYLMHSKITHRCTASGTGYGEIRQLCSDANRPSQTTFLSSYDDASTLNKLVILNIGAL